MHANGFSLSFEFFPPKTAEQQRALEACAGRLRGYQPEYVSVTFGAGGSTLDYTVDTVRLLRQHFGYDAAPHLSCMGGTAEEIGRLLDTYVSLGCNRIVALRGDLPSGMAASGEFAHAVDLVRFIRQRHGARFRIEVAAYPEFHPQALDAEADVDHFVAKLAAGADGAITQYFYNPDAYFRFLEMLAARGIATPVVAGIMPIGNFTQLRRFSATCGAEIPRWLERRMSAFGDDVRSVRAFAADVVARLCEQLLAGGAPGLHLYTLNRAQTTAAVLERLGLGAAPGDEGT